MKNGFSGGPRDEVEMQRRLQDGGDNPPVFPKHPKDRPKEFGSFFLKQKN